MKDDKSGGAQIVPLRSHEDFEDLNQFQNKIGRYALEQVRNTLSKFMFRDDLTPQMKLFLTLINYFQPEFPSTYDQLSDVLKIPRSSLRVLIKEAQLKNLLIVNRNEHGLITNIYSYQGKTDQNQEGAKFDHPTEIGNQEGAKFDHPTETLRVLNSNTQVSTQNVGEIDKNDQDDNRDLNKNDLAELDNILYKNNKEYNNINILSSTHQDESLEELEAFFLRKQLERKEDLTPSVQAKIDNPVTPVSKPLPKSSSEEILDATNQKYKSDFASQDLILVNLLLEKLGLLRRSKKLTILSTNKWLEVMHSVYTDNKIIYKLVETKVSQEALREALKNYTEIVEEQKIDNINYFKSIIVSCATRVSRPAGSGSKSFGMPEVHKDAGFTPKEKYDELYERFMKEDLEYDSQTQTF